MKIPETYQLSEAENEAIFQKIKSKIFQECQSVEFPIAVIFGGQPGSGKSKAVELSEIELKSHGGIATIIGDELRPYHPQHDRLMKLDDNTAALFTQHDAGRWVEKAITHAKNIRCNIIIESTMRVPNTVMRTMQELKEAGYRIEARALAVNEKLSWQGVLQRYENQRFYRGSGRMTPSEFHEAAYSGMLESLYKIESEKLVDKVIIYKRGATILYENELERSNWKHEPKARAVVEKERNRPWTISEHLEYATNFESLLKLIKRQERKASFEEIKAMQDLKNQAFVALNNANNAFFGSNLSKNDPYVYDNSNVLVNKLNIQDAFQLEEIEKSLFMHKFDQPLPQGNFDYNHLKAIHKHFFGDLYDWAGKERTVDIMKGNSYFGSYEFIGNALQKNFAQLARDNHLKDLPFEDFTQKLSHYFNEINAAHPFRDGNGRTLRAFCSLLSQQAGYQLQWEHTDRQSYIQANIFGFEGQNKPMENILKKICSSGSIALKPTHDLSKNKRQSTEMSFEEDVALKERVTQKNVKSRKKI